MARYDDKINQLLSDYVIGEGNRDVRDKKNKPKSSEGAPEQHMDEDEPDDDDTTLSKKGLKSKTKKRKTKLGENIEGIGLGGMMGMGGTGEKFAPPGWSFVDQDENEPQDKTGHLSDRELLSAVRKKGTAGPALIKRAKSEIRKHGSISSETRDSLARDAYASWAEDEEKPSAGLSKKKKSAVARKARAGGDIGKKGKGFAKVAKAAGGGEKGQKIAAAAMWKNIKR